MWIVSPFIYKSAITHEEKKIKCENVVQRQILPDSHPKCTPDL
jgi:hypothetical protein